MRRIASLFLVALVAAAWMLPTAVASSSALPQAAPAQRLILEPAAARTLFTFEGLYPQKKGVCEFRQKKPIRAKYRGKLELILRPDGSIEVIDALSFSNYLRGLAEVPNSWPQEALRAQAIAARSYALESLKSNESLSKKREYDICSTDQCQVYRGAAIELGAFGERWVSAVEGTRGKVLTYNRAVLPAYYFSTSSGFTRSSFPGGTPQPWLPSVSGNDEKAPLAHWTARIRVADLTPILREQGHWGSGRITAVTKDGTQIRVSGGGQSRTISVTDFRIDLNNEAPCEFPKTYPSQTGSADRGPLPQTVPSEIFTLTQSGGTVTLKGKGWGHGIGMSQYGARYMAEGGNSATRILKHFYGPAQITSVKEPGAIRVLAAEGLRVARIAIDGPVRIRTETGSVIAPGKRFEVTGGKTFTIRRGIGPSLKPILTVVPAKRALQALVGATLTIPFETSRSARVTLKLSSGSEVVAKTKEKSLVSGDNQLALPLFDAAGNALAAGTYQATVEGYDGLDRVVSVPIAVTIAAPTPTPQARASSTASGSSPWRWVAIGIGIAALAGVAGLLAKARLSRT